VGLILGVFLVVLQFSLSSAFISTIKNNNNNNNNKNNIIMTTQHRTSSSPSGNSKTVVPMIEDDYLYSNTGNGGGDDVDETQQVRVQPGTHDELMYALGVNLARQLGDIRPLVENGEELAQVAKGLLDTVVGRLNDDGQRLLLSTRGRELDELILNRA
jgi:hypothetical protein